LHHAYALTIHKAQGMTVEHAFGLGSGMYSELVLRLMRAPLVAGYSLDQLGLREPGNPLGSRDPHRL
jgi:hypothetical protein